jgi:hypothetical protein
LHLTDDLLEIWDNLVDWMTDGKEEANVLWIPGIDSPGADWLSFHMESRGYAYDIHDGAAPLPDPSTVDLVVHTNSGAVDPPTKFVDYPVPVITYNAGNHDDTLISSIGTAAAFEPPEVQVVEANQDHPVLGGRTGTIPWATSVFDFQGIGAATPAGSKVLATYTDPATELVLPALLLIEDGGDLLGAFAPQPEGAGFFVGGDLDASFGDAVNPRILQLQPVDVAGPENVELTVGLAASNVDFEDSDYLRVLVQPDANEEFQLLTEFVGVNDPSSPDNKALSNGEIVLRPDMFTDVTLPIPPEAGNIVIRFEAFNTFPNEVVAIDNLRVTVARESPPDDCTGDGVVDIRDADCTENALLDDFLVSLSPPSLRGDADGDGAVGFSDFVTLSNNWNGEGGYTQGDFDKDGSVAFGDFVILSNNWEQSGGVAAAAVPEPSGALLLILGAWGLLRRRP